MAYYNDYYIGGAYANHSSLMTGTGRNFHTPLSRFSPHLSTISESPLNHLRHYSPISLRHTRRVIDTADIDVSSPRIPSSSSCDRSRPRNRLCRDRPTIKIRSQAMKDNPILREHNEKHEKSVGELLMEKFYIKDKKSAGETPQIRLYHQINLDQDNEACEAIQKQITRRFTRRRSSADIQLDPEQLQREITYAQVQAKLLDNLVAEEQAQIANEARQGTLIRKGTIRTSTAVNSYYASNTDSDISIQEDEKTGVDKVTKATKKTKKKKRLIDNNPSPPDKILDNEQSNISSEVSLDDSKITEIEDNSKSGGMYKIEACNSAGDFSTIWINAAGNEKHRSNVEQFRESVKIPIPKKSLNIMDTFSETPKYSDEEETQIVLPVRKPYIKDLSRNSVYLTVKRSIEKLDNDAKDDENIDENQYLTNGFVDMNNKSLENDTLEDQTFDVDSPQLSSKVQTSQIQDTDLKEIVDKNTKRESSPKKHVHSTLKDSFDNDNSSGKYNTVISEIVGNIQDVTAINNVPFVKNTGTIIDSSKVIASTSTCGQKNDVKTKQIELFKDICHKPDVPAHMKKNEILKNDDSTINTMKKTSDHLEDRDQLKVTVTETPESLTADSIIPRTDKFIEEESSKVDMIPTMPQVDVTNSSVLSITCDPSENSANDMLTLSTTTCLPKSSKINTDRNNTRETPELSLGQAAYLANSLSSERVEDNEISVLPGKKVNKTPNLAKAASLDTPKKANGVNVGESTFKNDLPHNGSPILETKQMTLLKETTSEVRSKNDKIAELASTTAEKVTNANNISPEKNFNLTKCQKNKLEKIDGKNSLQSNLGKTNLSISNIQTKEINVQSSTASKKENLSQSTKTDIKKIGDIDVGSKSTNREKNFLYKSKDLPKMAVNENGSVNLSEINKNSRASVTTEIDNSKAKSVSQKVINTSRTFKKSTSVDFSKSANDHLSNLTLSDSKISQQSAPADEKFTDKIVKETLKPPMFLDKITEKKLTTIDTDTEELQQKDGQLSKSASTESIDFWSEIKTMGSPKWIRPKEREQIENRILDQTTIISTMEEKEDLTSLKRAPSNLMSENLSALAIKECNSKEIETDIKIGTASGSIALKSSDVEGETKKKIAPESSKVKAENVKSTVPKVPRKKKNVSTDNNELNSTVKKTAVKREDSASSIQSNISSTMSPTLSESTSVSDITVPLINVVEVPKSSESETRNLNEEDEDSGTPTNEPIDSSFSKILKWDNRGDSTKTEDTETPILSEEVSLANSPADSLQSSRTKRVPKKKKASTKKTLSIKNEKERKETVSESTSQQNTLLIKSVDKQNLAKPSPKVSPKASPKKSPLQRPQDLIRMFYTTPSALLTATPRDLSKVRRAKIKRRRHHSRTPSVNSDSTGSTTSTATTDSTDGSGSTCTELEDDTMHKNSTRSNDSGFDGSPRISNCDMACHKKCEKLTGNLCGLNQKLVAEALQSLKRAPSQSSDNQRNSDSSDHFSSGRITPPATNLPRFKKYALMDFHFLKVLGKGSFGKVLLAELRNTECVYAVKCLKKDVVLEDDDVECTLIERKVLTLATRHPYLCHLFCTFQTDSHLFFVMEYLNGGDLMFHIQKSGRFPETRARFYAAEIWSGLNFLHKKGIVYRDLKLDNVLLDFEGHIRIADFGMCKLQIFLDRTADTFCGTPDYMAPEIIKGLKYNQAVDWWSYGILLYEMLTGQSPFSGCDEDELFWSICNERPFIPRYLSQEATDILVCLLEKDSGKRPPGHEIAIHSFFQNLSWDRLERRQLEPPFKPTLEHTLDTKYFDTAFTTERPRLTPIPEQILTSMDQGVFRGFSYTNPNATD